VSRFKLNILEFNRKFKPEEFLDWVLAVEEVFEFNGVPDERRVSLVVHTFRGKVDAWWQQLKQNRVQKGKLKINSWEHLLKKMRAAFLPRNYTMERQPQNWRQWSVAMMKKTETSYKKEAFRETWGKVKSPSQANWTPTCQPQTYKPNPCSVEEEEEFVDEKFLESDFIDEEFEHKGVEDEDPTQEVVDWDTPPIYDDDVNEKEPIEEPLASDLKEEFEEYGLHPIFSGLYPDEDDQLEDEEPTDGITDEDDQLEDGEPTHDITDYEEDDITNYNEVGYVDFLGVEDILNSPNNDVDEFYTDEENYMFIKEVTADPFMSIFMERGREKEQEKYGKSEEFTSGVWGTHDRYQDIPMMRSVTLILGCCLVLIVRKGDWNELTGHPKDRGKDRLNSRTNSLQPGEDDADQIQSGSNLLTNERSHQASDCSQN
jgi:hypothetical protein